MARTEVSSMNEKLVAYIETLKRRVAEQRAGTTDTPEERIASEAVADHLELVIRELTGLLEIR